MTDDELRSMLRKWEAPGAPDSLRARVIRRRPLWDWLISGQVRIPVPVALALAFVLVFAAWRASRPSSSSLSDFEQVQLQPRIVRTIHETR